MNISGERYENRSKIEIQTLKNNFFILCCNKKCIYFTCHIHKKDSHSHKMRKRMVILKKKVNPIH